MAACPSWLRAVAPDARLLIGSRLVRSIGQGALVVDFSLYLRALHWRAGAIGGVLGASLLLGAVLTLVVGPLSDRLGRKNFLLIYEASQILAAIMALLTSDPRLLSAAAIIGGFGRGANGAAGPFGPVEQAWLAQTTEPRERGQVFSLNASAGFIGMAIGAGLAGLPHWLFTAERPGAYRLLFAVVLAGSLSCVGLILRARDREAGRRVENAKVAPPETMTVRRQENRLMLRLALVNALNGSGIGLTGPLISHWFAVRYGAGAELIGPMMGVTFLLSAFSALATGRLTRRIGVVRAVVAMRLAGIVLLLALPFAPGFATAAVLYTLRSMLNRGTIGARNALNVSLVRPSRRGLAVSLGSISLQIPRAIGPVLGGTLFQAGFLALPFLIGATFQLGYVLLYDRFFRAVDPGTRT